MRNQTRRLALAAIAAVCAAPPLTSCAPYNNEVLTVRPKRSGRCRAHRQERVQNPQPSRLPRPVLTSWNRSRPGTLSGSTATANEPACGSLG
jgi:hypothetical protein